MFALLNGINTGEIKRAVNKDRPRQGGGNKKGSEQESKAKGKHSALGSAVVQSKRRQGEYGLTMGSKTRRGGVTIKIGSGETNRI